MIDIAAKTEIILRKAGFDTWRWVGEDAEVSCFENSVVLGFVHVFDSVNSLLTTWKEAQHSVLLRHRPALLAGGLKAWNVYSVLLTSDDVPAERRSVERIEEDFKLTRKIASDSIKSLETLELALLPLVGIMARPLLAETLFEERIRDRLKDVSAGSLNAFFGDAKPSEVARVLRREQ